MQRMHDTLSTLHDLEETGIERRQAEAIVSAIGNAGEQLATKSDLASAVAALDTRIERAANRTLLAVIAVGGVVIAAIKLL